MKIIVCVEKAWRHQAIWDENLPKKSVIALLHLAQRINTDSSGVMVSVKDVTNPKRQRLLVGIEFNHEMKNGERCAAKTKVQELPGL